MARDVARERKANARNSQYRRTAWNFSKL